MTNRKNGITRFEPIHRYGHVAEIFSSVWRDSTIFHYVVQREGSTGIVHVGQELSEQRAREIVDEIFETLAPKSASRSA